MADVTGLGRLLAAMLPIIAAAGGRIDMGLQLRHTFLAAGLGEPVLDVHHQLAGPAAPALCRYMADSVRSMRATALRLAVPCPTADEIDALEVALMADAARPGAVFSGPGRGHRLGTTHGHAPRHPADDAGGAGPLRGSGFP